MVDIFQDSSESQLVRASALHVISCLSVHNCHENYQWLPLTEIVGWRRRLDDCDGGVAIDYSSLVGIDKIWSEVRFGCRNQMGFNWFQNGYLHLVLF